MKQKLFLILILLISNVGFAQNETNIWYFGENAGLDFNSGSPVPLLDGQLNTDEGCATISNFNGQLLFYTDGITVWNRDHAVMLNGTGLNGHPSSTHSAIIVPKPNNSDIYYIFTVDSQAGSNGLQYSEVDMTLDNGLGGITTNKNISLQTPVTEKITAIKSTTTEEYWVVSHKWESNEFISYNVSSTGVNTTPVISPVGTLVNGNPFGSAIGQIKISPDGTKIAVARNIGLSEAQLFDFNDSTGLVSNAITLLDLPDTEQVYGVEFSPNSKVLYIGVLGMGVYQFNLDAGSSFDIINSILEVSPEADPYAALQLATNGKIYVAKFNQFYIDVIDNPNVVGTGCNYQFEHLYLDGRKSKGGLPPFIQSFFDVAFQVENVCFGDATQFTANIPQSYDSLVWDFGDGNISTDESPTHIYSAVGDFTVTLTVTTGTQVFTGTETITIYEQPIAHPIPDQIACDNDQDGFYFYDLSIHASDVLNGQDPNIFNITYYDGISNYNNGIPIENNGSEIELLTFGSADPVISVWNVNNPDCEAISIIHIDVLEGANPSQNVPDLSFCDDTTAGTDTDGVIEFDLTQNETDILNGQPATDFTVNYYTDAGLTNQITNPTAYQNTNPNETIYVQVTNNISSECSAQANFNIEVYQLPTVTALVELKQCDDDLDGYSAFNLTEVNAEISANYQNETISFHETQIEAETNSSPIINPTIYINQTVSTDTVWARIENSNGCFRTTQVNLIVSTTQIPDAYTSDFYQCDDGADTTDGIATFNFSTVNTEIESMFPVGQQLIINYYRNQADALAENNPITDISYYQNIGYPNTQNVFIRVDSAVDNDCLGMGMHITLYVETVPVANPVTIAEQCDDDGDGMFAFDTSTIETTLVNGQTNVTVEYFDESGNPLPSPLPNPFLTATQNVIARVINSTSQDPDGACFDETVIAFVVDAAAVAYTIPDVIECDDNTDGQFSFNTSNIEATVLNGQTGMIVSYTDENGNPLTSPLPNPFVTSTQTITVRVENSLSAICFDETTFNFVVSEQPTAYTIENDIVCDDASNDGLEVFTLSNYDSQILNGQSNSIFEVFYFSNLTDAENNVSPLPNDYISSITEETIYARIQNSNNSDCYDVAEFLIGIHYSPIATQPEDLLICDDESNDGYADFDLSIQNNIILNGQSATENIISYHLSQNDAESNTNPLGIDFTSTENPQAIYARLENVNFTDCYTTTSFLVVVNEQPVLLMDNQWPICEGDTVEIIADSGYDEYLWSTGETTTSIIVDEPGTYEVFVSNIYGDLICHTSKTVTVVESNIATITNIETVDWTQNNNIITVFVEGNGDYEYSLDGISYQDSNEFTNLPIDDYMVYVKDKNGCGIATKDVYLLFYPKFFTPNSDGYNDTWQLYNSEREPNNIIYIFDRYGKLIKQISPNGSGWDGSFNSNRLSSDDYWFVLERQNGKTYRGHFTLKR